MSHACGAWIGITGHLWVPRQGVHGETDREPRGGVMGVVGGGGGVAARRRGAPGAFATGW